MRKKIFYLIMCLSLFAGMAYAQNSKKAVIHADETVYDFGTIKEKDGDVQHKFILKNTGTAPLVLTRVISSCGCAVVAWSKEPVAPGASSSLTVTYKPLNRVLPFIKTVSVYSNGKEGPLVLTIKGEVVK